MSYLEQLVIMIGTPEFWLEYVFCYLWMKGF